MSNKYLYCIVVYYKIDVKKANSKGVVHLNP